VALRRPSKALTHLKFQKFCRKLKHLLQYVQLSENPPPEKARVAREKVMGTGYQPSPVGPQTIFSLSG
jgi:hypothetical protein